MVFFRVVAWPMVLIVGSMFWPNLRGLWRGAAKVERRSWYSNTRCDSVCVKQHGGSKSLTIGGSEGDS
jgi:hypothetical protein